MGPCELMDLIGHDINFAVTQSVFDANFSDKRSDLAGAARVVDGGLLGRKSGRGFFAYAAPARGGHRRRSSAAGSGRRDRRLHGRGIAVDRWAARLGEAGSRSSPIRRVAGTACRPPTASCA